MSIDPSSYRAAVVLWNFHNIDQLLAPPYDLILGLGSYDLRVAHHVANLYQQGFATRIVLSGGTGHWTRRLFDRPEAAVFNEVLLDRGIPPDAVRLECAASNMGENILFTRAMLDSEPVQRILVVTKPHTKRRAYATASRQWATVAVTVSSPGTSFDEQPSKAHTIHDLINEMVGDLARMKLYPGLGYQTTQDIPDEVERAFRTLCQSGYTAHLPPDIPAVRS